jgi:hypothetical protein
MLVSSLGALAFVAWMASASLRPPSLFTDGGAFRATSAQAALTPEPSPTAGDRS